MMNANTISRSRSRALGIAMWTFGAVAALSVATVVAWFVGLDWLWAWSAALALGCAGAAVATLKFEEHATWDPPARETPRGIRLAMPMMEESLAACDRLARPLILRRLRAVVIEERDDRMARGTMLRQMRALLLAELRTRGVDGGPECEEAVIALLGPDAMNVLNPDDERPVTSATIANCLDAVERLATETIPSK